MPQWRRRMPQTHGSTLGALASGPTGTIILNLRVWG